MSTDHSISVSADALAHSQRVCSFLRDRIQARGGWIPFSEWMHHALYAPGLGYYAAGSTKLANACVVTPANQLSKPQAHAQAACLNTPNGDFVTAPQLTPLFGLTLAKQISEILQQCGSVNVLEFGAGTGQLALDILTGLAELGISAQYSILEVSADLKARQQELLAAWGSRVNWLDQTPTRFIGCVIANEVLDAMPVEVFRWAELPAFSDALVNDSVPEVSSPENLLQCGVAMDEHGEFIWQDRPAGATLKEAVSSRCPILPGYQSELNMQGEAWVRSLGNWLIKGAAILIDYGFPQSEYYHPQRHRGTLMCHIQHRAHDDALLAPGLQDITAHVDFTAIADAALASGLDVLGYTSQARFLLNAGLTDLMMARQQDPQYDTKARASLNAAVQKLISEAEMGELFKVMLIGRDIDPPLLGFSRGDRRGQL